MTDRTNVNMGWGAWCRDLPVPVWNSDCSAGTFLESLLEGYTGPYFVTLSDDEIITGGQGFSSPVPLLISLSGAGGYNPNPAPIGSTELPNLFFSQSIYNR